MNATSTLRQQYFDSLSSGLEKLFADEKHVDTTINVGTKSFKCHRAILAAMSPYFDAMFSSGMRESVTGKVQMEGIEEDIFQSIILYIYHGYDVIKEENAEKMLKASALLQMECLQKRCEGFLSKGINVENCLERWRLAVLHHCICLRDRSWTHVLKHFPELSRTEEFQRLDVDELVAVLKDDDLCSSDEESVCDAAMEWISFDLASRRDHLAKIFSHLRLPLTRSNYLVDVFKRYEFLRESDACTMAVDNAKNYHLLPARRHDFSSSLMCYRNSSQMEDVLVVLSGGETPKPPYVRSKYVLAYSFKSRLWFHLATLPFDPGIEFACCVHDNDIFVSGGGLWQTSVLRYRSKKNKWNQLRSKLKNGRRRHAMVAVSNTLYVIGGFNSEREEGARVQSSIEEYDLDNGEWTDSGDLSIPVSSVSAAVLGESIFLFGGEKNDKTDTASIQCFDTRTRTACVIEDLPLACKLSRSVVCDGFAYVVLFDGKVLRFGEDHEIEMIGEIKKFERVHFGLVHRRGVLYVLGGQIVTGAPVRALCDAMMKYDVKNNVTVTMSDRIPSPRLLDSCAKITIDKKFLVEEDCADC